MPTKQNHPWLTLLSTGIGGLIIAIDFTIVNTVLANVQRALNATMADLQWIMAGFGLLFCTLLVTMGHLGDINGRKKLFIIGLIGFGLSSFGAGISHNAWQLITCRVLQGVFGAIDFPCGMALVAAAFPKEKQGRALGLYGSILGMGLAVGPVLGGVIVHLASWRWIFFINVPFLLISLLLVSIFVKESKLDHYEPIDVWGALLLTISVGALVYAINELPVYGISSPLVFGTFILAIITGFILIRLELRLKYPLLPIRLLTNTGFGLSILVSLVSISIAWAILFIVPLYLHNVLGQSTFQTGLLIIPMTAMTLITPALAGHWYDKNGPKSPVAVMFALLMISYILQMCLGINFNLILILAAFVAFGLPWGMGNGLQTPLALAKLADTEHAGVVSGSGVTVLNILGVVSLAVGAAIFRGAEHIDLHNRLMKHHILLTEAQRNALRAMLSDPNRMKAYVHQLGHNGGILQHLFKQSFVTGYHHMLFVFMIITLICFILSMWLLKNHNNGCT